MRERKRRERESVCATEVEREWVTEKERDSWQIPGLWSLVFRAREVSRCGGDALQ